MKKVLRPPVNIHLRGSMSGWLPDEEGIKTLLKKTFWWFDSENSNDCQRQAVQDKLTMLKDVLKAPDKIGISGAIIQATSMQTQALIDEI